MFLTIYLTEISLSFDLFEGHQYLTLFSVTSKPLLILTDSILIVSLAKSSSSSSASYCWLARENPNFFKVSYSSVWMIIYHLWMMSFGHFEHLWNCLVKGAVPRGDATQENIAKLGLEDGAIIYRCSKCDCIKPERAHHCR